MSASKVIRPWGTSRLIYKDANSWTKTLTIYGNESLSLHYHEFRTELWFPLDSGLRGIINGASAIDLEPGRVYRVPQNVVHRIINPTAEPKQLIEVAHGRVEDADIIRVYDKYRLDWS